MFFCSISITSSIYCQYSTAGIYLIIVFFPLRPCNIFIENSFFRQGYFFEHDPQFRQGYAGVFWDGRGLTTCN